MKNLIHYIDLAFCLVVLPIMVIMFPIERWYHHFQLYITLLVIWLYSLYVLNRAVVVPGLFGRRRRRMLSVALIILSFLVTNAFASVRLYTPKPSVFDAGIVRLFPDVLQYQQAVWSLFMLVEAFSFAIGLLIRVEIQRERRREAEAQRDRAEINLYKAQIKPHFMFNTLNSLYGLFLTGDRNALPSLEKFISMMRYVHTTALHDLVAVSEEAGYIRQYVELQSLRLNSMTEVDLEIELHDKSLRIPPMLLVTFVENCFKHGISPDEKSVIHISLKVDSEGNLRFHTRNRKFPRQDVGEHLGIDNCRRRLDLSFPDCHSLAIDDSEDFFDVQLTISK